MNNLSGMMQERLDKWRENIQRPKSLEKIVGKGEVRRAGKKDFGDALTAEDWERECERSQRRK